jgi:hypothetical protein
MERSAGFEAHRDDPLKENRLLKIEIFRNAKLRNKNLERREFIEC